VEGNWFYELFFCPNHGLIRWWPVVVPALIGVFAVFRTFVLHLLAFIRARLVVSELQTLIWAIAAIIMLLIAIFLWAP
jgi:hypothetical protein